MKKLLTLAIALVLTTGVAAAQNTADVTQTGGNQTATITQAGSNTADVTQFTNNNGPQTSTVDQDGTGNIATVNMSETAGGNTTLSTSFIQQVGAGNEMTQTSATGNFSSGIHMQAFQDGTTNIGFQEFINGHTGHFYLTQTGLDNWSSQTGTGSSHADGDVIQNGERNNATQDIQGSNNGYQGDFIRIDQLGDDNIGSQDFTGFDFSHHNHGLIDQDGDGNLGTQVANGRDVDAQILQETNDNEASQWLTGNNNTVWIRQYTGDDNKASQTINNIVNGTDDRNLLRITQQGALNISTQLASGSDNRAEVVVAGTSNNTDQTQSGDDNFSYYGATNHVSGNDVVMNQTGDGNYGYGKVTNASGVNNDLTLNQTGDGNTSTVGQFNGSNNFADVTQTGDNNIAGNNPWDFGYPGPPVWGILQDGSSNTATLDQLSDGNTSWTSQVGNGNVSNVTQN